MKLLIWNCVKIQIISINTRIPFWPVPLLVIGLFLQVRSLLLLTLHLQLDSFLVYHVLLETFELATFWESSSEFFSQTFSAISLARHSRLSKVWCKFIQKNTTLITGCILSLLQLCCFFEFFHQILFNEFRKRFQTFTYWKTTCRYYSRKYRTLRGPIAQSNKKCIS